jgi:hypothetical protein
MGKPKIHMATSADVEYDLLGREAAVYYEDPPVCCKRPQLYDPDRPPKQTRFIFDVTCKKCMKLIQEARNAEYRAEQAAKNIRLGRPTTPEDDYVCVAGPWKREIGVYKIGIKDNS